MLDGHSDKCPLGTVFAYNSLLTAFTELRYFVHITNYNTGTGYFRQSWNLVKLRLPNGVTTVGGAFNEIGVMNWNFYPDTLTTMAYCPNIIIDTMIVPFGVTSIAQRAWSGAGGRRRNMRWIVLEPTTPPTFGGNPFYIDYSYVKVFVPNDSVDAYKAVSQLSSVKSRIYPISDFETYFPGESYVRVP